MTKHKITRKGSGRTKGSFSFVKISLSDLNAKFADKNTPVLVGRKWAEQVGFQGISSAPAVKLVEQIQGSIPEVKASITVTDLNQEDSDDETTPPDAAVEPASESVPSQT